MLLKRGIDDESMDDREHRSNFCITPNRGPGSPHPLSNDLTAESSSVANAFKSARLRFEDQNKAKELNIKSKPPRLDAPKLNNDAQSNIAQTPATSSRQLFVSKADSFSTGNSSKENSTSNRRGETRSSHEINLPRSDSLNRGGVVSNSIQFSRRGKQDEPQHHPGPSPQGSDLNENLSTPATHKRPPGNDISQEQAGFIASFVDTPSSTEKKAGEGGLAAALKKSRSLYDELVARKDKMVEKFRIHERECQHLNDLTCTAIGKKNVRKALASEREKEIYNISERISTCIDKSSKAVSDFLDQQEDAENCLLRANAAILNRLNSPRAATSKLEKRTSIREERSRVLEFLSTMDSSAQRQDELEAEMDRLLQRQRSLYLQDRGEAAQGAAQANPANDSDAIAHYGPKSAELEAAMPGAGNTPPNPSDAPGSADHASAAGCFVRPYSRSQSPMRSPLFSLRKPAAEFAYHPPDDVFGDKVAAKDGDVATPKPRDPEPKSWAGGVRATLFFSPFMRRGAPGQSPPPLNKSSDPQDGMSPRPQRDAEESEEPEAGVTEQAGAKRPGLLARLAGMRKAVSRAMASCEKKVAARVSKIRNHPPLISAAIKDRVEKVAALYEKDGTEALCSVVEPHRWNAAHYAAHHGSLKTLELLASVAPRLFIQPDRGGNTPAHIAAGRGHKLILRLLHRHMKAAFAMCNAAGKIPADCADQRVRVLIAALDTNQGGSITAQVLINGRNLLRKTGIKLT